MPAIQSMVTPIFVTSGAPISVNNATTEYMTFGSMSPITWGTSFYVSPISTAGNVSDLHVTLEGSGWTAGASWTYTLVKNGSPTALTVTFDSNQVYVSDTSHSVTVAPGDLLTWAAIPSGTPTAPTNLIMSCVFTSTQASETFLIGGSNTGTPSNTAVNYASFGALDNAQNAAEAIVAALCAVGGVVDKLYVTLSGAPGAGTSYAYELIKNGSPTGITCTVADTNTSGSDLSHSISIAPGDTISIASTPTNTPTARKFTASLRLVPTVPGESPIFAYASGPSSIATRWFRPMGYVGNAFSSATSLGEGYVPRNCTIKKVYTSLSTAPGAGKSRTVRSYKNAGYGSLSAQVTDSATTASDTSNSDSLVIGDALYIACDVAGTPASLTWLKVGAVIYVAP